MKINRGATVGVATSSVFCLFLISLTIFSIISLSHPLVSAAEISDSTSVNATVSVLEACTMNDDYNTYVPHTAVIPAGTNKSDIGLSTFRVICNDTEGFSVYAVGYANYEIGNTKLLATVNGTLNPTYDIETGLAMDANTSSWAMKLTAESGTYAPTIQSDTNGSFSNYHIVPSTNTKVATFNGVTDGGNNATGSAFSATYRANIKSTQPAGTYSGIVKYTMVHPATATPNEPKNCGTANRICYWPNAEGVYEGTMGQQTANANTETTLIASNFSKQGYGFAGWSDAYDWVINEGSPSNPDAHIYGPNETITTPSNMSNGLSLYAVWVKSEGPMQDWEGCSSLSQGQVIALTDVRDSQTYAVAKLADNWCYMIENLRLESTNSDNSTGALAQAYDTSFIGLADNETNLSGSTRANSLYSTSNIIGSNQMDRFPRYNHSNTNSRASNPTSNNNYIYSFGNYYTWSAAVADTSDYGSGVYDFTSICPKGWKLPIGSDSSYSMSFAGLSVALNGPADGSTADSSSTPTGAVMSNVFRSYPNNFVYSGFIEGSTFYFRGTYGHYWSSTASAVNLSTILGIENVKLSPGTENNVKYRGNSIRCVDGHFNST